MYILLKPVNYFLEHFFSHFIFFYYDFYFIIIVYIFIIIIILYWIWFFIVIHGFIDILIINIKVPRKNNTISDKNVGQGLTKGSVVLYP